MAISTMGKLDMTERKLSLGDVGLVGRNRRFPQAASWHLTTVRLLLSLSACCVKEHSCINDSLP